MKGATGFSRSAFFLFREFCHAFMGNVSRSSKQTKPLVLPSGALIITLPSVDALVRLSFESVSDYYVLGGLFEPRPYSRLRRLPVLVNVL
jgi:hypothetical protein